MTVRVYVAATLASLRGLAREGVLPEGLPRTAAETEDEEAEYAALMTAAESSAALLAGAGRRVVVVAEADSPDATVTLPDVVAVHCDTEDRPAGAEPDDDLAWFATQEIPDLI